MRGSESLPVEAWHRRLCEVTDWLSLCGDLPPDPDLALDQLDEWVAAGITDIVDVRQEWSDQEFVADVAPAVGYHHLGTHDHGGSQSPTWFADGLVALHRALANPYAKVLVHCHMGINRGPSMGFAFLLDQGWRPVDALTAIRDARPIAAVSYAPDALAAHHARRGVGHEHAGAEQRAIAAWMRSNDIDTASVIRRIRAAS